VLKADQFDVQTFGCAGGADDQLAKHGCHAPRPTQLRPGGRFVSTARSVL